MDLKVLIIMGLFTLPVNASQQSKRHDPSPSVGLSCSPEVKRCGSSLVRSKPLVQQLPRPLEDQALLSSPQPKPQVSQAPQPRESRSRG